MKTNVRFFTRSTTALLTVFIVVATSTLQAYASSPTDSTSTTEPSDPTTTTSLSGGTSTTSLSGVTTTLPDGTPVDLKNILGPNGEDGTMYKPSSEIDSGVEKLPEARVATPEEKQLSKKAGVDLIASAKLGGNIFPGFVFVGMVNVANQGSVVAGEKSPVSFSLSNIPKFATFKEVSPVLDGASSVGDTGWSCNSNTCTYVEKTASGTKNALLEPGAIAQADLQFNTAADAVVIRHSDTFLEDAAKKAESGDFAGYKALTKSVTHIVVTASTSDDIDPSNNDAAVMMLGEKNVGEGPASVDSAATAGLQPGVAGVHIDSKIRGSVYPGGPFHMELRYLVTGSETQSGKVKFTEVIPAELALTDVKVSGTNWTCDSVTNLQSCETSGPDLKPGDFSETLIIDGTVGKAVPLKDESTTWVMKSNSTTIIDSTPVPSEIELAVRVVKAPVPDVSVQLSPRDGVNSVARPGTVTIDAMVNAVYGPAQSVLVAISLSPGLIFKKLDTKVEGWECKTVDGGTPSFKGGSTVVCSKEDLARDASETLGLIFEASESAESGVAPTTAIISAKNEGDNFKAGNSASQDVIIQPQPAPMPGAEFSREDENGAPKVVSDGSATKVRIGKGKNYSFTAKNLGSKTLAAGQLVRFEQFVDNTAIFSGASFVKFAGYSASLDSQKINTATAGKWVCVSGTGNVPQIASPPDLAKASTATSVAPVTTVATKKSGPAIRCEIKLASAVEPGKATPSVNLTVRMSNSAKVGTPEWPVFVTMLGIPGAPIARFGMTVDISEDKIDLVPSFLAPAGPRPGGSAVASLSLRNSGDTDAKAQFVVVPGMKDGRITGVKGDSWKCARLGTALSAGFTICSRTPALKVGTETPALSLSYQSTNKSTKSLNLQAASLYGTSRNAAAGRGSNLSIDLRPALSFAVKGPGSVIDQIVDVKGKRVASTVLFTAEGNSDGATYVWKQLCTTDADVKASGGECKSVTPAVKWADNKAPTGPSALFSVPVVTADTTLLFDVKATESGTSATTRASVVVIPLPTVDGPTGKSSSGAGSSVLRRVPQQSISARSVVRAVAPTSGTGDATYSPVIAGGISVNGNVFGARLVTVAQSAAVSLTAAASGVGAITYAWSQASGPTPSVIASANTNAATLSFTAPAANTTVTLRVEATDSRGAKATDFITVTIGSGGTPVVSATITGVDGPLVVDTSQAVTLTAVGAGSGTLSYAWTQVSGTSLTLNNAAAAAVTVAATSAIGDAVLQVVVTDGTGAKATAEVALELKPSTAPVALCKFVEAASNKTLSTVQSTLDAIGIGGVDLAKFTATSSTCTASTKVNFSAAGFSLGNYLTVSDASGSISNYGLTIRTARFTGPTDWGSPQFAIATTDSVGLFIPFTGTGASVGVFEGEVIAAAMPFLKLPAGYTSSAALRFSVDAAGVKSVSLDANATGTPANGKTPSARVYGAIATNGTFTLDGSMTDAVDLFGTVVNFAGKVTKTSPTTPTTVALSGSLVGPVTLTSGVVLNGLTASRNEEGIVTGSGTVTIGTAPSALVLTADMSYTDTNNHSLTVTASAPNSSWTAAKDIVIPLASASGTYTNVSGARNIAITVVGSNSTPMTGLAIKAPTIAATATCAANASCAVALRLAADAEITLGSTATTGRLEGNFNIAEKSGSFTATIGSIPVVAGLQLTTASLAIQATKVGAADQATTITLSGSASVFGATVTASAVFTATNILLTADLPEIKLFGDSGPVFKPGQLVWSSGALTGFTPKVPSIPSFKTVNLAAKVPRISMAIALPSEISGFAGSLVASVGDIALDGEVNFSTGAFSLAASMSNDTLDASGAISRANTGASYQYNLTGKIKKAVVMNSSVKLTALDFTFGNTTAGGAVTFAGTGGVEVALPDTTVLSMNGSLTYNSSTNYSLAITVGASGTTFPVTGGEALSLGTASGSLVRNASGTVLNVALSTAGPWKPVSGLSVSNVTATAALTCAIGATCVPTFNVTGTLGFDLGISALNSVSVTGSLTSAGFTFSATFGDLVFSSTGDIKLTAPTLSLSIPAKTSTDSASATLSGNFSMFGATVSGSMRFSSAGVLLVGTVPIFFINDTGFNGGQFAWLLKGSGNVSWTPVVPNLTVSAVSLPVGTPKLLLSMPVPDSVKQLTGSNVSGVISVGGDMTLSTGAFSMNASYTSSNVDVSGSVSRANKSANLTYSLSAAVKNPVSIVDGVTVNSLTMSVSNATGSLVVNGSGSLTIGTTTSALTIGFGLNYTSATQYSFNLAFSTGNSANWSPFSGLTLPVSGITGSMARNGNTRTFAAAFKSNSEWVPFPGLKVAEPGASFNATCTIGAVCALTFNATGKVSVNVGSGWQGPATITGTYTNNSSALSAQFADLTVTSGVVIGNPSLSLVHAGGMGVGATVAGSTNILGTTLQMSATFSASGVLVTAGMNNWTPIAGITLANASFVYSTFAANSVILPSSTGLGPVSVAAGSPTLIGAFNVPSWLRDLLKQPTLTSVPVKIPLSALSGGQLPTIQIMLPTPDNWYMYNVGGSSMRFTALGFEISGGANSSLSMIGRTEMKTGAANEVPIPLEIRGTVATASISLSLSLGTTASGAAFVWNNAFGVTDLTITQAAIQMGITLTAPVPLPSLGIAATAILPATWRSLMGMEAGVAVRLAANIDVSKPCFALQAGTLQSNNTTVAAGSAKVISVAGGALSATYMSILIAPLGCTIGNVVYAPGIAAGFIGTVFGVNVSVNATIGTNPFSLEANMSIGGFNVGPVSLDQTMMGVKISPTENFVSFAGGVTIGNTRVAVNGRAGVNTTDGPYLDLTGSVPNLIIVPNLLEVRNTSVTMNLKPSRGYANIIASGGYSILGTDTTVSLNMQMSNYQLQSLTASVQLLRGIAGVVSLNGTFNIAYTRGSNPTVSFTAAAVMGGYNLGTASGTLNGNQVSITATASIGGVFSAQVSGQFVWQAASGVNIVNRSGQTVTAVAGDFRLAANNFGMNLGGFTSSGSVVIGRAQNVVYGDFNANWSLGSGDIGGQVYIGGSFDTNGGFSFTGSANLNLLGFNAGVNVSGSRSNNNWTFNMSSNITVMGAINVAFNGYFYASNGSTRFVMNGSTTLGAIGFNWARGNFKLSNEPWEVGLNAQLQLNLPGFNGYGSIWVASDGRFNTSVYVGVNFPGVNGSGWLTLTNVSWVLRYWWENCQNYSPRTNCVWTAQYGEDRVNPFTWVDVGFDFVGGNYRVTGVIDSNGGFDLTQTTGPWEWDYGQNFGIVRMQFEAEFGWQVRLTSSAPYLTLSAYGEGTVEVSSWGCRCRRWRCRCGWSGGNTVASAGVWVGGDGYIWTQLYGIYFRL